MTKKTVYIPSNKGNLFLVEERWNKSDVHFNLKEQELYTFTEEELNQYTESVIRKALVIAAENLELSLDTVKQELSIINSFGEVYENFKV